MRNRFSFLFATAASALSSVVTAGAKEPPLSIGWDALRPAAVANAQSPGRALSLDLKGRTISLTGYALPSDRDGDLVYQFLLLPWTGLCSHMAPPPPNQAVLITSRTPFRIGEAYATVAVTGVLEPELEKTQLFIVDGVTVIETGYRLVEARIAPAGVVTGAPPRPSGNPWSFLRK